MGIHDDHLAAAIGVLVEHSATGMRAERDGIVVTSVGSGGPEFNTAWVTDRPADPGSIAWAREALSATGQPWMLQGSVDVLDGLDLDGLAEGVGVPLMVRPATTATPPPPDHLRIAVARDGDDVRALGRAMSTGFGSPDPDAMVGAMPASLLDDDRITLIGGWLGDDLVATSVGLSGGASGLRWATGRPGFAWDAVATPPLGARPGGLRSA